MKKRFVRVWEFEFVFMPWTLALGAHLSLDNCDCGFCDRRKFISISILSWMFLLAWRKIAIVEASSELVENRHLHVVEEFENGNQNKEV